MFNNKTILITGGTGNFGKNFARYLIDNYSVKKLVIFSRDELKHYEFNQQLGDNEVIYNVIGDIRDKERLNQAMLGIDYVIHAAALKHSVAIENNPLEAVKTNIHGVENIINAAIANNVEKVINLSSSKACNPINLYGTTKLASDKLFVAANNISTQTRTSFSVVRFGNIAGSTGSVLPLFKKLVSQKAKALPITNKEMTRFWITINQAMSFVEKSFQRMQGGEIFVPKIPTIKIIDLANAVSDNLPTEIIGTKAGEKKHELLITKDDAYITLEFKDHYVIKPSIKFFGKNINYLQNNLSEHGINVKNGFEYNSQFNTQVLSLEEIKSLVGLKPFEHVS